MSRPSILRRDALGEIEYLYGVFGIRQRHAGAPPEDPEERRAWDQEQRVAKELLEANRPRTMAKAS